MTRKHHIVRKILENVPPNHFLPRPYYLDILDSAMERNTIICKDQDVTLQFISQALFKDLSARNPGKCLLVVIPDETLVEDTARTFAGCCDTSVFVASMESSIPKSVGAVFMSAESAAKLCCGDNPIFSIPDRVFLLIVDDCEHVFTSDHPYQHLFPCPRNDLSVNQIEEIWNRDPTVYSSITPNYRILCLTSSFLPVNCSDHSFAKEHICSMEDRLKCRLETTSELINLLSLGAQPDEEEIPPPIAAKDDNPHPITGIVLHLLKEAHDFLTDLDFTGSEENVSTSEQRVINVPYYCFRAVAQCESITKDLGVYCGALIARVFLRHLYRLERARAAILETRQELEHGEDLLTRILRYTATQLSMVARLFQTACDNCMTKDEIRTLASPRVRQLVDHLRRLKPTSTYKIEAVLRSEGGSDVSATNSEGESSESISVASGRWSTSRNYRKNKKHRGVRPNASGFVAPHGLESMSDEENYVDERNENTSISSFSTTSDDDVGTANNSKCSGENSEESGAESDATDVSMGLSSGIRHKSTKKIGKKLRKIHSNKTSRTNRGGSRIIYRVIPVNPEGVPPVPPLCGLLLVGGCQFSAYALPRFIEEYCNWDPEIAFVRPGYFFVPGASDQLKTVPISGDVGSTQEETVANFRCGGEVNLLVTTQSGLAAASSLPRCNLIASFQPSTSLATYLAAKSRLRLVTAKSTKAHFWHFLEQDGISLRSRFQEMEKMLLQRSSRSSVLADEHDVDAEYVDQQFDCLPKKKASRSIDIVNHYCARLPCNFMTRLAPRWSIIDRRVIDLEAGIPLLTCPDPSHSINSTLPKIAYRCALQAPINSPISQVVWSDWSLCKKMAKYSAAVRLCRLLLEAKEIDAHGRPILRHAPIAAAAAAARRFRALRDCSPPKNKSSYLIKTPDQFKKCLAKEDRGSLSQNYLYLIDMRHLDTQLSRIQRKSSNQGNSSYIDFFPEAENRCFGLLTSKPIPEVPEFSIFTRSGEESVSIRNLLPCPPLNIHQLNRLSQFHRIIFKSVLRFEKDSLMKFNLVDAPCQLLIVLVKRDTCVIDWELIDLCLASYDPSTGDCRLPIRQRPAPPVPLSAEPIPITQLLSQTTSPHTVFDFVPDEFTNSVLMPTYRQVDYPPRYYVVSIRYDMSPATPFPSSQYATFADYYACKYGLHVSGAPSEQPLLDVAFAPLRLAPLLAPRGLIAAATSNRKPGNSGVPSARHVQKHIQFLIPEFCHRHPMPATVWQKAVCLPTILYRLQHLLLAEELRSEIARETGLGIITPHASAFPPLRCHLAPTEPSTTSPPQEISSKNQQGTIDNEPGVVKLSLSEPKTTGPSDVSDGEYDPTDVPDDVDEDGGDDLLEEFEEEADVGSLVEKNARKLCFFPPDDNDDIGQDERGLIINRPGPAMILQSLTLLAAGDFINMERLETIGDSFLKFAVTVDLYLRYPDSHEGHLSALRSEIVGNSNLYRLGCEKNLPGKIVGSAFEPQENWLPPCYISAADVKDNFASTRTKNGGSLLTHQFLTNKSIADCVESLVGCYLTERGERSAMKILQWFGVECLPPSDQMMPTGSPWKAPELKPLSSSEEAVIDKVYQTGKFYQLEEKIGYKFKNRRLLIEAFTHSTCRDLHSAPTESDRPPDACFGGTGYERLEFLGDAVLDYVVTRFLFSSSENCNDTESGYLSPGALTDLRSALVNNAVFGALAVRDLRLHTFLRATSPHLTRTIAAFVEHFSALGDDLDALVAPENKGTTLPQADGDRLNEEVEVPKALGDVFESLAGALFLDSDLNLNTLWSVFFPLLRERMERYSISVAKSPVRRLLEFCPERVKFERPRVRPDGKLRVGVRIAGVGRYVGIGRTYRLAKTAAADLAYRRVREATAEKA